MNFLAPKSAPLLFCACMAFAQSDYTKQKFAAAVEIRAMVTSGQLAKAEPAARALVAEIEAHNGPQDSMELAAALEVLTESFARSTRFHSPEEHAIADRALAMGTRLFAPEDHLLVYIRRAFSDLQYKDEDYRGARATLVGLVAILDAVPAGRLPPGYEKREDFLRDKAGAWTDLVPILRRMGDLAAARDASERALAILHERGLEDREMAVANNNLASLMLSLGDREAALRLYRAAMTIYEKTEGPESPLVAGCLNNMGQALTSAGRYAEAEPLLRRSLEIATRTYGIDNVRTGHAAGNLANTLSATGDYAGASQLWQQAKRSYENSVGPQHTFYAAALGGAAGNLFRRGRIHEAVEAALEADRIDREYLDLTVRGVPEREALLRTAARASGVAWTRRLDALLSFAQSDPDAITRRAVMDAEIRDRGVMFDELAARARAAVANASDPRIAPKAGALAAARARLSQIVVKGPAGASATDYGARVEQARRVKADAEMALAEASTGFREEWRRNRIGIDEISGALGPGDALISYVAYGRRTDVPGGSVPSYLAFVLRAGTSAPGLFPLGDSARIDAMVAEVRKQVLEEAQSAGRAPKLSEAAYRKAAEQLRQAVWDPPAASLVGVKRVFIVADGQLDLVSFAALPVGQSEYLIDRGPLLHYLSSERGLVREAVPATGTGLLALAASSEEHGPHSTLRGSPAACADFQSLQFGPLPGSAAEVREIAALWTRGGAGPVTELTGAAATKPAFERMAAGKRVLHLAVHGFYLGGCGKSTEAGNPLLLSGLALSRDKAGIVTGEEILPLDLSGVEWAVLSACDSGVGDVQTGEGVFGMRRAFELAGVRTVILSLWPVDDAATREWMSALYRARYLDHQDTAESSRRAGQAVLAERRKKGLSSHPFYWAGFVAAGDWR